MSAQHKGEGNVMQNHKERAGDCQGLA
jgi:hypothetical protein